MNERTLTQQQKTTAPMFTPVRSSVLQRKCACGQHTIVGGACAACRKKQLGLQRRPTDQAAPTSVPPIVHEVLRSPGQPLDPATRAFMEPRFGHDFSRVRVHTDAKAAQSARAVNALAYTVGRNVVFGASLYAPGTSNKQRLLTHELTHVVQQGSQSRTPSASLTIDTVDSSLEREADRVVDTLRHYSAFGIGQRTAQMATGKMHPAHELTPVTQQPVSLNGPSIQHRISPMIQRAVRFSPNSPLTINHWTAGTTTIAGDTAEVVHGDFEAKADIHIEADTAAELANWEVGFLQNDRVTWNRAYWTRTNDDRRGRFLERKLRVPTTPLRDHLNDAIVWAAPGEFADVASHAGGALSTDINLTSSDEASSRRDIDGSDVTGDASDGTDNIFQFRQGDNFISFVSAHNTATDEWRHLELIYWSVQDYVDFTPDPAGGVRITRDDRQLGQSRRFRWTPVADQPAIGATRANEYVNDPANILIRRVEGWT